MKSDRTLAVLLTAALLTFFVSSLGAEDWTTTDGKVYQNVVVLDAKPDAVTILHRDGGALVPLAKLPPAIQKRFNYDPAQARAAAVARVRDDAANGKELQAEMDQASRMRQAGPDPKNTDAPAEADAPAANDGEAVAARAGADNADHHSMAELSLGSDPSDANHHSMDELFSSMSSLRRDLSDPAHHTMAHLSFSIRSLGSDPSDPNHHSMSEIANSGL